MSENNYGALMLKSALDTSVDVTKIIAPGIYPVTQGNASAPDSVAGSLTVAPVPSGTKVTFERQDSSVVYSLINGKWEKPTAVDVDALAKLQNGGDIPDKDLFVRNIGAARAFNGGINIGGGGNWTTAEFIAWLENQGAFNHPYWMCKGSWSYANNRIITDTGCGNIQLAGAVIEVMGHRGAMTIRVTTATAGAGTLGTQFTYTNHGDAYSPGWRRDFNTTNKPTSEDVGALPITGGTVSGYLGATGIVQAGNSKKFALSSENTAAKNANFNLWGNAARPVVIEMRDESGWHFYSQRNTDGSITLSINGQVTPSNYGNFDARYQPKDNYATQAWVLQNFVQNIRQSGVAYIDAEKNSGQRLVPAGGVLIGSQVNGEWDNNEGFYYTWTQQNINGNWLTIGRV